MTKKLCFLVVLSFLIFINLSSQTLRDTIIVSGSSFIYRGIPLSADQLLVKMQNSPGAYSEMSIAKLNYDVTTGFIYVASFCTGFPIGQALAGAKPAWGLLGVAAGAVIVAVPFSIVAHYHAKNAVRMYNSNLMRFGLNKLDVNLEFTAASIGLRFRF